MKTVLAALALVALAACGTDTGATASDPTPQDPTSSDAGGPDPTGIPAADGLVSTRTLVTVMDTGTPELCLGAVAESYPPQCSGPQIVGWSWADQEGVFEKSGDVRWGLFFLTGTWDGETFTVRSSIPGALYDPEAPADEPPPAGDGGPAGPNEDKVLASLESNPLPGTLTVVPTAGGITVDVVHDDGSLQRLADQRYGAGVVVVTSALVPVQR